MYMRTEASRSRQNSTDKEDSEGFVQLRSRERIERKTGRGHGAQNGRAQDMNGTSTSYG